MAVSKSCCHAFESAGCQIGGAEGGASASGFTTTSASATSNPPSSQIRTDALPAPASVSARNEDRGSICRCHRSLMRTGPPQFSWPNAWNAAVRDAPKVKLPSGCARRPSGSLWPATGFIRSRVKSLKKRIRVPSNAGGRTSNERG